MTKVMMVLLGSGAALCCLWDLFAGLRSGRMRTLAYFTVEAERASRPGLFWLNASLNLLIALGMGFYIALATIDLDLS